MKYTQLVEVSEITHVNDCYRVRKKILNCIELLFFVTNVFNICYKITKNVSHIFLY